MPAGGARARGSGATAVRPLRTLAPRPRKCAACQPARRPAACTHSAACPACSCGHLARTTAAHRPGQEAALVCVCVCGGGGWRGRPPRGRWLAASQLPDSSPKAAGPRSCCQATPTPSAGAGHPAAGSLLGGHAAIAAPRLCRAGHGAAARGRAPTKRDDRRLPLAGRRPPQAALCRLAAARARHRSWSSAGGLAQPAPGQLRMHQGIQRSGAGGRTAAAAECAPMPLPGPLLPRHAAAAATPWRRPRRCRPS